MKDNIEHSQDVNALVGVRFERGTDIDQVLVDLAQSLRNNGAKVAGLTQIRGEDNGDCNCRDLHLLDLSTGQKHLISEQRGPEALGCHLDWQAIANLAQMMEQNLSADTDVLIINRFGRSESEGRGFRSLIEKAMLENIQVVVAFCDTYEAEWAEFHGGLAANAKPDVNDIAELCNQGKEILSIT